MGARAHTAGPSLAGRFAAAIALTVGFYVLALVIAGALLVVASAPLTFGAGNLWVSLTALVLGVSILIAIFPRRRRFEAPGVRLDAVGQTRLMELIADEARACGERPPHEVYATLEVNAAVTEVGRRRRVMIVGLPLLALVSERGLRGVIAHEFGHYVGGDTRLGPWIYRTRETIGRTIAQLSDDEGDDSWSQKAVRLPFIWYGKAFLRITNAISRRQEFAADALAARHTGRDVHVEALQRVHAYAPAFDAYWAEEVVAVLRAGRRPPVADGFAGFMRTKRVQDAAATELERELAEGRTGAYDSHPSLAERIAAVQDCEPGEPDTSPPAATLVQHPVELERRLLVHLLGPEAATELQPLDWSEVGREVYLERARSLVAAHGEVLAETTAGELGARASELGALAGALQQREPELPPEAAPDFAATLLADALVTVLARQGWAIEAPHAEPVLARRGEETVAPHVLVDDLRRGRLEPEEWRRRATELRLADERLFTPSEAPLTTA